MAKNLVIVESPTKAKTLSRFLGSDFKIVSSNGHVRDLPKSQIGVDVEKDFEPSYVVPTTSKKTVQTLKKDAAKAETIYFASDEDREGEAISWHLAELLQPKPEQIKRITFHEITKNAITEALKNPREIDQRLVDSQQARRILDRLVGYELSPLLWKKIAYGLSAGRVQSVAVRLIVERELERRRFVAASYWDIIARLAKDQTSFESKLVSVDGQRLAQGKDYDDQTGKLKEGAKVRELTESAARDLSKRLEGVKWVVTGVEEKPQSVRPASPFITSTLQQEANRKLYLSSRQTMRIAQGLYEEGLITYMRTDSPALSKEGIAGARHNVEKLFGKEYLSPEARQYASKSKSAQEAHEAIRPAGPDFVQPNDTKLSGKELALYELIWKRTLASQMAEAKKLATTAQIAADNTGFVATGSTIVFPGFLKVYFSDGNVSSTPSESVLPKLNKGDDLKLDSIEPTGHETKPPARYNDATLVKTLEQHGVGRPSTYASIIGTILDRNYVRRDGNALVPTFTGFAVDQLLKKYFAELVDTRFTSKMEQALDDIAEGKMPWQPYLKEFYAGPKGFHQEIEEQEKKIDPEASRRIELPNLQGVEIRIGRFGPYLVKPGENGGEDTHATIPEDVAPADLAEKHINELIELSENGPKPIGHHPETKEPIFCLTGRFGPYVQLGEKTDENPKPKRSSIPKGESPSSITVDRALVLLSVPRVLGQHPESSKDVIAGIGRFGPFIVHDGDFRSLKKEDDVYTVKLDRALELLSEEKKGRRKSTVMKELGNHPKDKSPIQICSGKYGPYVKHKRTNVSLPEGTEPESVTLEQALELLKAKKSRKKG
ncbi:MAG: type I DNA topoisomerase [bacterium]|nr:type I DNA topoisomerase [bacterium]